MSDIGSRIRKFRIRKGLSQKELGQRIHKSQQTVNCYENGTRNPGLGMAELIAEALGVSFATLTGSPDAEDTGQPAEQNPMCAFTVEAPVKEEACRYRRPELIRLVDLALSANEDEARQAADLLEFLVNKRCQ